MGTIRRVTDAQVKELRKWLLQRASLSKAAMKTDMDRKSARKYRDLGQLPSEARQPHDWRTREDPLAAVWPELESSGANVVEMRFFTNRSAIAFAEGVDLIDAPSRLCPIRRPKRK